MNTLTEPLDLLRAYADQHDQEAFRRLMEQYFRFVFGVALRVTGSTTMSEEVCQDVFLLLSQQSRKLLAKEMNLAGWLHRVAWNKAQNMRVREQRGRKRDRNFAMEGPAAVAPQQGVTDSLDEALEKLREADRNVLLWHYVDQLSFKEIAERLTISAEAAQKRSMRALRNLEQFMKSPSPSTADAANSWSALLPALLWPALPDLPVRSAVDQTLMVMVQAAGKISFAAKAGAVLASSKGLAAVVALVVVPICIHNYPASTVVSDITSAVPQTTITAAAPALANSSPVAPPPSIPVPPSVLAHSPTPAVHAAAVPPPDPDPDPAPARASAPAPETVPTAPVVAEPLPVAKVKIGVLPALMKYDVTKFAVFPGQSDLLEFTAPMEPGDYPYICTFPGHTIMMHGIMIVRPAK